MAITLYQMRYDLTAKERFEVTDFGDESKDRAAAALDLFRRGGYHEVAVIETDDLEEAYRLTQNGVVSDSWSRNPPPGVKPTAPGYVEHGEHKLGYKSSEVGDLMKLGDKLYVVDTFGFAEVTGYSPEADEAPAASAPRL